MGLEVELIGSDWREVEVDVEEEDLDEIQDFFDDCLSCMRQTVPGGASWTPGPLGDDAEALGATIGGYGTLHVLRAFARHVELYGAAPTEPAGYGERPNDLKRVYDGEVSTTFPHLVHFSDGAGWYVSIDFSSPIVSTLTRGGPWQIGSSVQLLAELDRLEPHLPAAPDLAVIDEDSVRDSLRDNAFAHVIWPWAVLRWLARGSVARNAILRFG